MNGTYFRFGGISAIIVGLLSLLYALFYLVISRSAPAAGASGSWLILGLSGLFTSAALTALFLRVRRHGGGLALWAFGLGVAASFATFQHGVYEFLALRSQGAAAAPALPSQVDPAGLTTFFTVGLVTFLFSMLILRDRDLPVGVGYLGLFNALLLVILYFASAAGSQGLVLVSGGLTSVIVGPIWWVWLGIVLIRAPKPEN